MFEICAVTHVGLSVKCPLFMSGVYQNWNALTYLSKILPISNFLKIGSEVHEFHECRRTEQERCRLAKMPIKEKALVSGI